MQMILKQKNSNFTTYEIPAGIYTIQDISEVLSRVLKMILESEGQVDQTLNIINPIQ